MKGITREVVEEISKPENKIIMILGGIDVGKTFLIENIAEFLSDGIDIGIVDIDMGQSRIGPPTTIGWGIVRDGFKDWEDIEVIDMFFVGDTSPFKNLLPTITGAEYITGKAKLDTEKILIDTTGLVLGVIGRILKWNLIEIIRPDIIITLERENELDHLLKVYKNTKSFKIFRLPSPRGAKIKSQLSRNNYRKKMFREYFKNSKIVNLSSENISVRCYNGIDLEGISTLKNRVVSLRNFNEEDLALGIISEYDNKNGMFSIITPKESLDDIRSMIIGAIMINKEGEQLEKWLDGE